MKTALKPYTILYAEDDLAVQKSTTEYLQRFFKEVVVASDGREALQLYKKCQVDVVLLDIEMPHIDGISVATQIRQSNEMIPIIMLTAFTDVDLLLKATELNLCTYLVKPLKAKVFKEALQKVSVKLSKLYSNNIVLSEGYSWNAKEEVLYKDNTPIELSIKEKILLSLLIKNRQKSVSFEEIMAVVWEDEFEKEVSIDAVKFHISKLRKKLPKKSIESVYGRGFMFI
jgi:DNA-binding response OmpR family regulator